MRKMKKGLLTVCLTLLAGTSAAFMVSCKDKGVKISFDVNGGEAIKSVTLKDGASYDLPTPVREGYSFEGWYLTEDFTGSPVTTIVADKKATYYAKWEQMYLITLNLDGGALAQTSLYVKAGANVYDFMKAYTPTKDGYEFGAWFNGDTELNVNAKMPASGLTLTAKYKVGYTVQIYEQNLSLDGYTKRAEDVTGYAYAGKPFTSEQTLTGFREVVKSETVNYKAEISENASENVFVHYFDREEYTVTFHSNPPEGSDAEDERKQETVVYGNSVNAPYDYTLAGYCLVGWATSSAGKVVYESNYIDYALFGDTNGDVEPVEITPEKDMALYAVWEKGYTDMFGNYDYLFLVDKTVVDEQTQETTTIQEIYLSRGDVFFKGDYDAETKEFYFEHNGETLLEGFLKDNGKFVYKNTERADVASTRFVFGKGLNSQEKINFDAYDKITYTKTDADGINSVSTGTFYISDEGYYIATFTEGELAGQTLTMLVGYVSNSSGGYDHAFQLQNENEVEIGTLAAFAVYNNSLTYYIDSDRQPTNTLTLNGFGTATLSYGSGTESYSYVLSEDEETLYLYDSSGNLLFTAKIMYDETLGMKGYMVYNDDLKGDYSVSGGVLTLDGVCNATLERDDGTKITAYYSSATSLLGGTIVSFQDENGKLHKYMITVTKSTIGGGITQVYTTVDEKHENYSEYYYKDDNGLYYAPMLVMNNKAQNDALLYGYTSSKTFKLVSKGTYTYDETTKLYTYTASEYFDVEVLTSLFDISKVQTMIFAVDTETTGYSIHYWYSYTTEDGTIDNRKEYTSRDGADTLLLVSGIAVYKKDGSIVASGLCSTDKNGLTTLTATDGKSYYFELTEETKELEELLYAPYELRFLESDGSSYSTAYKLVFDGKGGVSYVVTTGTGDEKTTTTYVGTICAVGQTVQDAFTIYRFHADATDTLAAVDFEYIEAVDGNGTKMFAKYNANYNGEYISEKDGKLTLDGFGYYATYYVDGGTLTAKYFLDDGDVVRLMVSSYGYLYFDLNAEEKTFTLRGSEFGTYLYANNQELTELLFELDGYGNLKVYTTVKDEDNSTETETKYKKQYIDENGTYAIDAKSAKVTLRYTENGTAKAKLGTFGYYTYNSSTYNVFIEHNEEIQATYVNASDYSVLTLDGYGNATKYIGQGKKEYGSYTIVSDSLLYYVNQAGTDACVYVYDAEQGSIVRQTVDPRGYYTANLESLLFTEYGFAIFGGKTTYYYYLNEQGNVTIYRRAKASDTQVNEYGFVEEDFGSFDATKQYGGRTYYASNGFTIPFNRNTTGETKYPVKGLGTLSSVTFTPTGDGEFTVSGTAIFVNGDNKTSKTCTVTRKVNEDDSVELYVTCELYRFDITVEYSGNLDEASAHNTFTVNKLTKEIAAPSNSYWFMYMFYSYFGGSSAANSLKNTYGEVAIVAEYDETGAETGVYFKATFGESSKMYDADGELVADWLSATLYDHKGNVIESIDDVKLTSAYLYKVSKTIGSYNYHLYFQVYESPYVSGVYGCYVYAFVREETIQTTDGAYTLCIERVITSDYSSLSAGHPFKVELTQGEGDDATTITGDLWYSYDGYFYIVDYTKDDNKKITAAKYYKLKLAEESSDQVEGSEGTEQSKNPVPVYTELQSVEIATATTLYAADGVSYIDVITDSTDKQTVMLICIKSDTGSTTYIVRESSYDEATKTYTIKLSDTLSYTAKVSEDGATVTIEAVEQTA